MKFYKIYLSTTLKSKVVKIHLALFLMLMFTVSLFAQTQTLTGIVTDSKGESLMGVVVQIKGNVKSGSITDAEGKYSIAAPTNSTLVFSCIGYVSQSVLASQNLKIVMQEDAKKLDEVVVTGYGTQKKPSLTGAISQIKGDEAFKNRGLSSPAISLQGEIPGLVVTRTSTRPGNENASMKIRGDISINGSSSPLIIIDGISGSLDELNEMSPNDIETISVLKDASAAIYGARSAAGVILVTTKHGKKGAAKITYSGLVNTTIDGIRAPLTNNSEWLDMFYQMKYEDARATYPTLTSPDDIKARMDWWIFKSGGLLSGTDANGNSYYNDIMWNALRNGEALTLNGNGRTVRFDPNMSLMDYLYGQAVSQKHSLSISGGDDKFKYMAALGYSDAQSQLAITEDDEKKYSGRLNMDYQATKLLKIATDMSYEKRDLSSPSTDIGAGYADPWIWPVYTPSGKFYDTFSGNRNPVGGLIGGGRINTGFVTTRSNVKAVLDLSPFVQGLNVSVTGGYKTVQKNTQSLIQKVQYYDWADNPTGSRNSPGSLTEDLQNWENKTIGGFVNYDNTFSKVHHVTGMLGVTSEEENWKEVNAARNQGPLYSGSGLEDLNVFVSSTTNVANGGQSSWGLLGYITRLNYSYDNKYLLQFLARRDGSSKLFPDQRWRNFYSLSGGWVISQENFMRDIKWLDFLKIFYNYGKTGNVDGIGNYEPYSTLSTGSSYFGTGTSLAAQTAIALGGMTSSSRTWETIIKNDASVNFAVLNNRLSGSFDYFVNKNEGMFIAVTYPSVLGANAPTTNNGKLRTKGWEFALDWKDKIGSVTYFIGGSLSDASTELLRLTNSNNVPLPGKNTSRLIGKPLNAIYAYRTNGLFQTQAEVEDYYNKYYWANDAHTAIKSGNIIPAYASTGTYRLRSGARKLVDLNGDQAITASDLYYAGDAAPHLTFGIKTGFEWNGFDVQAFFQGVGKQVVLRGGSTFAPLYGSNYLNRTFNGKTWTEETPDKPNPVLSFDGNFNKWNYINEDVSVQRCRYIRLKNLVVGYTLPSRITSKLALSNVRVYFSGDDLWEMSSVKDGFDPEFGEASNSTFPFSRLLSFGFDVTF